MTACENPRCGKEIDRGRFCNEKCAKTAWYIANREKCRASLRASRARFRLSGEPKVRKPSAGWLERRAAIVADHGVPGMGTKGGRPTPRVIKGEKF